jgi:hypothetical protein
MVSEHLRSWLLRFGGFLVLFRWLSSCLIVSWLFYFITMDVWMWFSAFLVVLYCYTYVWLQVFAVSIPG